MFLFLNRFNPFNSIETQATKLENRAQALLTKIEEYSNQQRIQRIKGMSPVAQQMLKELSQFVPDYNEFMIDCEIALGSQLISPSEFDFLSDIAWEL